MGVQPCEIEFDRFLLLIGEQASGKSTIAKLIYFFQSLPDAFYRRIILAKNRKEEHNEQKHEVSVIGDAFFEMFGGAFINDFKIEYHYNNLLSVSVYRNEITKVKNKIITVGILSPDAKSNLRGILRSYLNPQKNILSAIDSDEVFLRQNLLNDVNEIFSCKTSNHNYLIAGRNNVVAYPDYFERKAQEDTQRLLNEKAQQQNLRYNTLNGNEKLLLEFINWSSDVRKYFQNNGSTFNAIKPSLENKSALTIFEKITEKILKGEYRHDSNGEYLNINKKERVQMKDASSGQQEALRILQGFFLSIGLKNRREFFVVEEPEAHLYPLAQKELINAFALFLNTIKEGRLIITTHSPYILACVNILLFANYVANELPEAGKEVLESVQKEFWLDSKMFSAYSLGHDEVYCTNIKDAETGLIDQNYLDAISEQLGTQYYHLYNLLVKSHV